MLRSLVRTFLVVCTVLGILLPQGSAVLAALGLSDGRVIVICTGDGLRTLRVGEDGQPMQASEDADFCALVHAVDTSAEPVLSPQAVRFPISSDLCLKQAQATLAVEAEFSLPRAPPLV